MNKQLYIKPAITVFAVQPLAILAGSGTGTPTQSSSITGPDDLTSGDGDDVWE